MDNTIDFLDDNFKVVFIDDNFSEHEPLVQAVRKNYPSADYKHIFKNPKEGLEFVLSNLDSKMIVFIDWNFDTYREKGIDLLKAIRQKTSLLYIVMMSANKLGSDIPLEEVIYMMNEENFFYLDKNAGVFETSKIIIDKICSHWKKDFDCILEQWLVKHPEDNYKEAYSEISTGKKYTWFDILKELRLQSPVGKDFENKLNEYYIYQLKRSKK